MARAKTVLVVDDDLEIRDMLYAILVMNNYNAYCIADSTVAVVFLKTIGFDVVISDFLLAGLNGIELARIARRHRPQSFIIGMSGNNVGDDFLKAGANAFLKKPFNPDELLSLISSL
jgi:DNA-binding response OmpR family regulator